MKRGFLRLRSGASFAAALLIGIIGITGMEAIGGATVSADTREMPDVKTREVRDLNTHHLFSPPATRESWEARKKALREQILFSAGLWPMPAKTPLHPRVTGRIDGPDYTIENVAIETLPGFYMSGSLYRPKGKTGPFPGIANPHGHWANGRLEMQPDVPLAKPAPAKMGDGRGNLVSIGVNLARQGHIVFAYDCVGYNDTMQLGEHHGVFNGLRPWLWNISLMGLQLWNSIRAVDYLESLTDVDKTRLGATGASGGGSQTFLLTAVDDRIKAAVPVNMVSASMQGGCLCENGPGLRVGTDNVEVASMMAPKPMLMVAATGDWTRNNPTEEWPAVKKVYDLYSAGDRTEVKQFNYQHNYNVESREAMYAWFGKWLLHDPNPEHFREKPFTIDVAAMHVWNAANPFPADALKEPALTRAMMESSEKQLAALWPKTGESLKRFQKEMRPALLHSLALSTPPEMNSSERSSVNKGMALVILYDTENSTSATRTMEALRDNYNKVLPVVLAASTMKPEQLWSEFFTCYNQTPAAVEAEEAAGVISSLLKEGYRKVDVVAMGKAGLPTLLARGLFTAGIGRVAVDTAGFASDSDDAYLNGPFAPGLRRAGDFRTAAMLAAPAPLCLFNTAGRFKTETIAAGYKALRAPLKVEEALLTPEMIAAWMQDK